MLCQFERLIYPQNVSSIDAGSFMIAVYRPCENIKDSAGNTVTQVKAVGYCLPIADKLRYELQGHWSKNPKHGVQFEVENYMHAKLSGLAIFIYGWVAFCLYCGKEVIPMF